jgi:hypothetical protein
MKIFKTILIISIFLPFAFAQAQVDNLVVEFQQTPLFNEANFLPGEGITRWAKVTNNSGQTQRIAVQPLNITDLNRLGDVLNLEIKEGGVTRYNNALSTFFAGGENYLSDLANGATSQYDFTVSFYSGSQNTFQGKTLGFDILIGFQGTEGGILPGAGSTSGGGGGGGGPPGMLPPGLTIQNETTVNPSVDSVTITWTTSYPATSQVIYALGSESHILDLTDTVGAPPKYGYARTTLEYDTPANIKGVLPHSITITGLTSGTTYYYRTVSHGSLAISTEHSFTTLTLEEAVAQATQQMAAAAVPAGVGGAEIITVPAEGTTSVATEPAVAGNLLPAPSAQTQTAGIGIAAATGMILKDISQSFLKSILVILALIILIFLISKEIRRKKKQI